MNKYDEIGRKVSSFECNGHVYDIYVNSNEQNRDPHFHVADSHGKFEAFVSLTKPKYVQHHQKHGKLTKEQISCLLNKLSEKYDIGDDEPYSIYSIMCIAWNLNYDNIRKVNVSKKMPDYIKLNKNDEGGK